LGKWEYHSSPAELNAVFAIIHLFMTPHHFMSPVRSKLLSATGIAGCGLALLLCAGLQGNLLAADETNKLASAYPKIQIIDPPENGFFAKLLLCHGLPIKASAVVEDDALFRAYDRISMETQNIPNAMSNLVAAGGELHIIGRNQVTTDLPEFRSDKHVPLYEPTYNGLTRDRRTRGMGGLMTSCGEENLLNLPNDHYKGSDICLHEFAHEIEGYGMGTEIRAKFDAQAAASKAKGLWLNTYAGSNPSEYFAELTMWYWNSHGSYGGFAQGAERPGQGTEGLKKYDPEAFVLFEQFYSGKMEIPIITGRTRRAPRATKEGNNRSPAGLVVAKLYSYKVGETKLSDVFAGAGIAKIGDEGKGGWVIASRDATASAAAPTNAAPAGGDAHLTVSYVQGTYRPSLIADLEFKDGVMTAFKWDN
jgi:hypothetical protein